MAGGDAPWQQRAVRGRPGGHLWRACQADRLPALARDRTACPDGHSRWRAPATPVLPSPRPCPTHAPGPHNPHPQMPPPSHLARPPLAPAPTPAAGWPSRQRSTGLCAPPGAARPRCGEAGRCWGRSGETGPAGGRRRGLIACGGLATVPHGPHGPQALLAWGQGRARAGGMLFAGVALGACGGGPGAAAAPPAVRDAGPDSLLCAAGGFGLRATPATHLYSRRLVTGWGRLTWRPSLRGPTSRGGDPPALDGALRRLGARGWPIARSFTPTPGMWQGPARPARPLSPAPLAPLTPAPPAPPRARPAGGS